MADHKLVPPFASLRAFESVGRLGGIRKAGRELGIDHAVVSRHIRTLETWVGRALLERNGAGYQLTAAGAAYHGEISRAVSKIASATGVLMDVDMRRRLSIWCIPGFGFLWLADRLNVFIAENPDIDLTFIPSVEGADFRAREVNADIRYLRHWEEQAISKVLHCLELARPNVVPVASPSFKKSMKRIGTAADLMEHTLLHEDNDQEWRHWFQSQGMPVEGTLPGPRLWHAHMTLNAARNGHGIALANNMLLGSDLEEGRLELVHPADGDFSPVYFGAYTLIAPSYAWNTPELIRFRQWLLQSMPHTPAAGHTRLSPE